MTTIIDGSGSAEFHTPLPVAEGGTGATASTGSGNVVLSASPTLTGTVTASGSLVQGTASSSNRTFLRTAANWNYSQLDIKRNASNTANFKAISFQLDGDTDGDTNLYNYPNILINTDSAPTTGDTSVLENASLTINTPSTIRFGTNGAERMRIASDGAVTLGTPLPVGSGGTGTTGGSGWVKLATTGDITSGTSFTIDNCFSTTYHKYRFVYDVTNGGAASGNNYVAFRLRTGGASGADLTSTYHYRATRGYSGHANTEIAAHDRNYVNDNYNRLDKPQHGVIDIFRYPLFNKPVYFDYQCIGTHPSNDECFPTKIQGVNHTDATSITGLKLYLYSGETSSAWTGRMTVYGAIR